MSLILKESPNKLTQGVKCYANACEAQLPYKYIRQDWDVDHFEAFGSLVTVVFMAKYGDVQPSFTVGESVVVKNTSSGNLELNAIITEVGIFGGKTLIRTDILVSEWTIAGVGYTNQYKSNYRVVLSLWTVSDIQTEPYDSWYNTAVYPPLLNAAWVKDAFGIWNVVRNSPGQTAFLRIFGAKTIGQGVSLKLNVTLTKDVANTVNFRFYGISAGNAISLINRQFGAGSAAFQTVDVYFTYAFVADYSEIGFGADGDSVSGFTININSFEILENNQSNLLGTEFRYSTNPAGELFVNWGQLLTEYMEEKRLLSFRYTQARNQEYDGYVPSDDAFTEPTQSVYSWARQLQEIGGSNLWEFVANLAPSLGRALTHIQEFNKHGLCWRGWNRTVSYLIDDYYQLRTGGTSIKIRQEEYDINQVLFNVFNIVDAADLTPRTLIVSLNTAPTFPEIKYIVPFELDSVTAVESFARTWYELREECANPIMLDWLNGYGAPEQHLFNISQTFQREAENGLLFERGQQQDIEDVNVTKRRLVRAWTQRIILEADRLTKTQFDVLTELKSSDFVRCYLNKTGTEFVEVIVINNLTDGGETIDGFFTFQVQIEFPDNFDFFKGKLY